MARIQIVFGTVVRNAPVEKSGELLVLDWNRKAVLAAAAIYPRNPSMADDVNPRGNTRGCKGIEIIDGKIVAADFHTLNFFDFSLAPVRTISHGLMVGLHEINYDRQRNSIWVASTVVDSAVEFDLESGALLSRQCPRDVPEFQSALQLSPSLVDWEQDNRREFLSGDHLKSPSHLHLNAVLKHKGELYCLCHAKGAVCNLTRNEVVVRDDRLIKSHNLRFVDDQVLVVNDTFGRTLRFYDTTNGGLVREIDLMKFEWVRGLCARADRRNLLQKFANKLGLRADSISRPIFVRGLDIVDSVLYVGMSPASIISIDSSTGQMLDAYQYASDPQSCVHGLRVSKS